MMWKTASGGFTPLAGCVGCARLYGGLPFGNIARPEIFAAGEREPECFSKAPFNEFVFENLVFSRIAGFSMGKPVPFCGSQS